MSPFWPEAVIRELGSCNAASLRWRFGEGEGNILMRRSVTLHQGVFSAESCAPEGLGRALAEHSLLPCYSNGGRDAGRNDGALDAMRLDEEADQLWVRRFR